MVEEPAGRWRRTWHWTGIGSDVIGRVSALVLIVTGLSASVDWLLSERSVVISVITIVSVVLIFASWILTLRAVRRNWLRDLERVNAEHRHELQRLADEKARDRESLEQEHGQTVGEIRTQLSRVLTRTTNEAESSRVIPPGWAAIIRGLPVPGAVVEVVPPGCEIISAGPGAASDDLGNTIIGADRRMYNVIGGGNYIANGSDVGTRPYPLYVVPPQH